ncbi:MAG: hypothetical protein ABEJ95_01190 [Candidatus Nanohalobium sp.]
MKEIHEENAKTYKDISDIQIMELLTGEKNRISDTLFQMEDKEGGLGEEEQKEIEMLLQGRY